MVAYSFKKRFVPRIEAGSKGHTLRLPRKGSGHAKVGQQLQLYYAMRTKYCRKIIDDQPCLRRSSIVLIFDKGELVDIEVDGKHLSDRNLERFAVLDGFDDLSDMSLYWNEAHVSEDYSGPTIALDLIGWLPW